MYYAKYWLWKFIGGSPYSFETFRPHIIWYFSNVKWARYWQESSQGVEHYHSWALSCRQGIWNQVVAKAFCPQGKWEYWVAFGHTDSIGTLAYLLRYLGNTSLLFSFSIDNFAITSQYRPLQSASPGWS